MFEHSRQPLLPRKDFIRRMGRFAIVALFLVILSLLCGVLGYHFLEGISWIDSILNAAMILGGMGPVNSLYTNSGKIFASLYALFSGVVFLVSVAVLIAPLVHRLIHKFHIEKGN